VEEETVPMINTALPLEAALKEAGLSVEENSEVQEETKETLEVVEEEPVNETSKEEPVEENNEEPEEVVVEEATEENTLRGAYGTTKVKVEWLDDKEHDESVNIYLAENESAPGGAQFTLPTDNKYEIDLEGIDLDWVLIDSRFDSDNEALLKEYTYTVTDTPTDTGKTIIITLTKREMVTINVTKKWVGGEFGNAITVTLMNGEQAVEAKEIYKEDGWVGSFTAPKHDASGNEISYTVKESQPDGGYLDPADYSEMIPVDANTINTTITNIKDEKVTINVTKVWNGGSGSHDSVTVKLLNAADGSEVDSINITSDQKDDNGNWYGSFTDLPKYNKDGEIQYEVEEVVPAGYSTSGPSDYIVNGNTTNTTITNTLETTDLKVTKVWEDNDNEDGIRPESITVELLADGEEKESVEVTEADGWKYTFKDLPKYNNGQEIIYTVKELNVEGYNSTVSGDMASGYTVTNTHESEKIQLSVTKVWDDENDKDKMRPASVTVKLLANGKDTGKTVTLNEANGWKSSFTDLNTHKDGKEITYNIEEVVPNGYSVTISGDAKTGYTLTNTHKPSTPTPTPTPTPKKPTPGKPVVPYTGDDFNMWMYLALLSGGMLVSLLSAWKLRTNR
ncbi:MAG: Cna B-type domain-containing protein, partial [Solobacterium sp.]|nr:Cna B-type domain-containing protein [Solobacterium sp.]